MIRSLLIFALLYLIVHGLAWLLDADEARIAAFFALGCLASLISDGARR